MNVDGFLTGIRQSMRVFDGDGLHLGYVRDISGCSILVNEASGRRVFWVPAAEVCAVGRDEVHLAAPSPARGDGNRSKP